jgi:N-acetylated-alpha-linked acidic dipeptidase
LDKVTGNGELNVSRDSLRSLNELLLESERKLTSDEGLPGRPWFKHLIYAPGLYTGYGVKTVPGVREAIEVGKWQEADQQIVKAAAALDAEALLVDSAAQQLEAAAK